MGQTRLLVIGYGNPSRGDDGLGPALAERVDAMHLPGVTVEADYQLSIEHAALAAEHDVVVFADAAVDADGPCYFRPLSATDDRAPGTHAVSPAQVVGLARTCFAAAPRAYILGMRAHALDGFVEGLTSDAAASLEAALGCLLKFIAGETGARAGAHRGDGG